MFKINTTRKVKIAIVLYDYLLQINSNNIKTLFLETVLK